ncbi:hypothetical protein CAE01nite_09500 [Cellulomonas aerilata]|uniref:DUF1232 domain-containing protein n=1 Tax=Cellulomonas aerilata TaxID=515326 RepID=A0A512D9V4_9CELL|nr:hypothetical protein CAE01nite_09500 [Cellulomonas aerilata]
MRDLLLGLGGGLLAAWVLLAAALLAAHPGRAALGEALRVLPDLLRLLARLARDRAVPRTTRVLLWLTLAYLAFPIDLIPDVVPVLGYADDAIVVTLVLRAVVRRAGEGTVERCWPGTPDGLAAVTRLTRARRRPLPDGP